MPISRRRFLAGASALGTTAAFGLTGCPHRAQKPVGVAPPGTPATTTVVPPGLPTIREAGASRNLLTGTAVNVLLLQSEPAYAQLIEQQANIIVGENELKFGPLRPTPDTFFFDQADYLFSFATTHGMKVRGHNFVWHEALPTWFSSYVTPANAQAVMERHIETVGGRYAGRVQSWDVVNEAILVEDKQPGGLRLSPWYKLLGPGYLDLAYRTARRADPTALLTYNDYGIEGERPEDEAKRAAVLGLLRGMQGRGVPIDAVGIQSHIVSGDGFRCGPGLERFMSEVQGMGLKIMITELDINDRFLPGDVTLRDQAIAQSYRDYLHLTLRNLDVIALLTWGITDKYTWLNGAGARTDNLAERCLPFDADLRPTLAYPAEVEAIQAAPMRAVALSRG